MLHRLNDVAPVPHDLSVCCRAMETCREILHQGWVLLYVSRYHLPQKMLPFPAQAILSRVEMSRTQIHHFQHAPPRREQNAPASEKGFRMHRKIERWRYTACYNANTDSYPISSQNI